MSAHAWAAPYRAGPIDAAVRLPGSKSLTNRALILAAIAEGPSTLSRPLHSRDTDLMIAALRTLGARIDRDDDSWTITPPAANTDAAGHVDCGLAGTVMRFVPPAAALASGRITFDGDARARRRPIGTVIDSLRTLGVEIDDGGRGALPFDLHATGSVAGGPVTIDASASSQFVSALLLAGARYDHGVDVRHVGRPVPSTPHIDMTISQLRLRGVRVDEPGPSRWIVAPGPISALDVAVEPDLSNAGAFVAAALATAGRIRVRDWPATTDQAGDRWREIATRFGADVVRDGNDLVVSAPQNPSGIEIDLHDHGELTPVVAAVCAVADGPSVLTGIAHLRGHETDRLKAIATEVNRLGGDVTELDDGLAIRPRPLHGAVLQTYADHRMAHAAAVLGLVTEGTDVVDIETTAKTFPGFAEAWVRIAR